MYILTIDSEKLILRTLSAPSPPTKYCYCHCCTPVCSMQGIAVLDFFADSLHIHLHIHLHVSLFFIFLYVLTLYLCLYVFPFYFLCFSFYLYLYVFPLYLYVYPLYLLMVFVACRRTAVLDKQVLEDLFSQM